MFEALLNDRVLLTIAIELLAMRVWHRSIRRTRSGGGSPKVSTTPPSTAARLPQEIVEIIIAHLIYDTPSLIACSLTCYSWYIAAGPQLHRSLTILGTWWKNKRWMWTGRLKHMERLGLLPLVKKLQIHEVLFVRYTNFSPRSSLWAVLARLIHHIRWPFFALPGMANVRELGIDNLDIPTLMPKVQRYFRHFLPTLRSLDLRDPKGSCRQILYFIGLFQHLDDLKLLFKPDPQEGPVDDPTLVPPFTPPLRGRLAMTSVGRVGLLKEMVHLFGGIRFRQMDLLNVAGMQLLLGACAETLETLRLYPTGEQLSLKGVQVPTISQVVLPSGTSIYHRTSRFGHSRSRRRPSVVR